MSQYSFHSFCAGLLRPVAALFVILLIAGCTGESESDTPAAVAPPMTPVQAARFPGSGSNQSETRDAYAPEVTALSEATFNGILDLPEITLTDGRWVGEPYEADGATRPAVMLVRDFLLNGDLDGDGQNEAVVFLETATGGSGAFLHLAVMGSASGELTNLATEYLGDRVQIIDARMDHDQILLTLVRAGPDDAVCCPGEIGHLAWQWLPGEGLLALSDESGSERLGAATLADREWVLTQWNSDEPAAADPRVTLSYSTGQLVGSGGCNRYFAGIEEGDHPGAIRVAPVGSTQMACPEHVMAIEQRFLTQLQDARRFDFLYGDLLLTYGDETAAGSMRFRTAREAADD
ncbi:MAG: META domain-containing protein [Pseudomonadales bacterium]|nr:META domain-containing protein [Pseudomonadales bacterium]